jgi:rhodanese-related sulfurtransferase
MHKPLAARRVAGLVALLLVTAPAFAGPDISAPEAMAASGAGGVKLIDIRTPQEWRQTGVAPGAGRVDFYRGPEVLVQSILQMVGGDKNAPIALICRTGNRTTQAQHFLQSLGFTQVYNVKEGMAGSAAGPGWLKRGLPVESCTEC